MCHECLETEDTVHVHTTPDWLSLNVVTMSFAIDHQVGHQQCLWLITTGHYCRIWIKQASCLVCTTHTWTNAYKRGREVGQNYWGTNSCMTSFFTYNNPYKFTSSSLTIRVHKTTAFMLKICQPFKFEKLHNPDTDHTVSWEICQKVLLRINTPLGTIHEYSKY